MARISKRLDGEFRLCGECELFGRCRREVGAVVRDRACWEFLPRDG